MTRSTSFACAALALLAAAAPARASAPELSSPSSLPAMFVQFFYEWKSEPGAFQVSELKVLKAGGSLRVLCGVYELPGQGRRPFLVFGDDKPSASAAWEPGSFPETDPSYPQVMQNLRLCQTSGAPVTADSWRGATPRA
jgi:hypothetical protein